MTLFHFYGYIKDREYVLSPFKESVDWKTGGWWYGHFIVVQEKGDILTIQSTNESIGYKTIEIKRDGFAVIGKPTYITNDRVCIPAKNKIGRVYSVTYHFSRECFRYMVDYGDRKSTCWYYDKKKKKLEESK